MSENINKQLDKDMNKDMNKDMDNNIDKLELYSFVIYLYIYIQFYIYAFKHNFLNFIVDKTNSNFAITSLTCTSFIVSLPCACIPQTLVSGVLFKIFNTASS